MRIVMLISAAPIEAFHQLSQLLLATVAVLANILSTA